MKKTFYKEDIIPFEKGFVIVDRNARGFYDQKGWSLFMDRFLGGTCVMDDKHIQFKDTNEGIHTLYAASGDYNNLKKVVACINLKINGVPVIDLPYPEETLELKIIRTVKLAVVRGQDFTLAALFRDEEKRIMNSLDARRPEYIELEIEPDVDDNSNWNVLEDGGHPDYKVKVTNLIHNSIKPLKIVYG